MTYRKIVICLLLSIGTLLYALPRNFYATESKLASGKWVKIKVGYTGVFKLSYEDILKAGFPNPDKVKVYGYGGEMLPETFSKEKKDDLPQVGIYKDLGGNGIFDKGDYILFVGKGPVKINYTESGNKYTHQVNPYSFQGYYFLSDIDEEPKYIQSSEAKPSSFAQTLTSYDDIIVHEKDLVNISSTGREFFGEDFGYTTNQDFKFSIPGIIRTGAVTVDFIAKSSNGRTLKVAVNSKTTGSLYIPVNTGTYDKAEQANGTYSFDADNSGSYTVSLSLNAANTQNARLNYIRISAERELKPYSNAVFFRNRNFNGTLVNYTAKETGSDIQVWNITDATQPVSLLGEHASGNFTFSTLNSPTNEYLLINPKADFERPAIEGQIGNQNLHGLGFADYIIITDPEFMSEARELADLHVKRDGVIALVTTPQLIYNEFSSGTPDISAYRWFLKMFYDRAEHENEKPKNVLLFGDGIFDNRGILSSTIASKANRILTYQSENSVSEIASTVTDDFIVMLDDNEGKNLGVDDIDAGIGRIPARSKYEAQTVVKKIITYTDNKDRSSWKNDVLFVADDGDSNLHMRDADLLAQYIENNHKEFNVEKVYLDAFKRQSSTSGATYPEAKKKMYDILKQGVLMVDLVGHGNSSSWTGEDMINLTDIKNMYFKRVPLWVTATCDFGRFDDNTTSAGEQILFHPEGGGIALFSTSRVVYSSPNFRLNSFFCKNIFGKRQDGTRYTLGEVMKESKRAMKFESENPNIGDANKLKFFLFGDPGMKLAYPEYKMRITKINGKHVDDLECDTLKALSQVLIEGEILDHNGEPATWFNGNSELTIYDAAEKITSLDNDNDGNPFVFYDRSKVIFKCKDKVTEGNFKMNFVLSKDISYRDDLARISLYASDVNANEAQGFHDRLVINGTSDDIAYEENGPAIKVLYLNTPFFKPGSIVNESPMLYAEIEDETGLNISQAAIGHEMQVIIDNDPSLTYVVNNFFTPISGDAKKGIIRFPVPDLTDGAHTLKLRVWDVFNNSSSASTSFEVKQASKPEIYSIYYRAYTPTNLPTIGAGDIDFFIKHDRPENKLNIEIRVYDLAGKLIWNTYKLGLSEQQTSFPVSWNLRDNSGLTVRPGHYLYQVIVSTPNSKHASEAKKMVIVSQ